MITHNHRQLNLQQTRARLSEPSVQRAVYGVLRRQFVGLGWWVWGGAR
jgi:hypothetical protein